MSAIFAQRSARRAWPAVVLVLWFDAFVDVVSSALRVHADILRQDLRYVARTLGRSPGFAATVVVVTALGVGATTAAFSITDHVLFRPLPFPEPDRLVQLWQNHVARGYSRHGALARQLPRLEAHEHLLRGHGRLRTASP